MDVAVTVLVGINTAVLAGVFGTWVEISKIRNDLGVLSGRVEEQSKRLNGHDEEIRKW